MHGFRVHGGNASSLGIQLPFADGGLQLWAINPVEA